MRQNLLSTLLSESWWSDPGLLWEISALAACLALGWALARIARDKLIHSNIQMRMVRLGVESFSRVLWPLIALALIALAKPVLAQWYPVNLLRIAIPLVGSFALIRVAFYVLRRVFARGGQAGGFLLTFEKVFALLVWGGVALYITGFWPDLVQYLAQTEIPVGRHKVSLLTVVQAGTSVVVTLFIALWAGALLEGRLMRMDSVHASLRAVMARMVRALFIVLAVLLSLSLVGIDLTVLSVFGGALGIGLGFGLQKIISSYVSGFIILLERSLAIGDFVTVDKYSGQVTKINTRYTIVRGLDGIETVVPNEMLLSGALQNYSLTDRDLRLATRLTVSYDTDIDQVLQLLQDAAASIERVAKTPEPGAFLLKFDANGFELELGFWISDPENGRANVLSDVNRAIWGSLQKHQIQVPHPQRDIRLIHANPATAKVLSTVIQPAEAS